MIVTAFENLYKRLNGLMCLTQKFIDLISSNNFKLLKPIYFMSDMFYFTNYKLF